MNVLDYYNDALSNKGYTSDPAQKKAIERLQVLYDELNKVASGVSTKNSSGWLSKIGGIFNAKKQVDYGPKGVYLWGGVGRGKSFLMDAFYDTIPFTQKVRIHFHEFMRSIHAQMKAAKQKDDPLMHVAEQVAQKYRLICFDEFHVSDIADAMILYRLLQALFERGVTFVMTSNYEPSTLYPDGLQRERFLPAIALIQARMDIINVDVGVDYRMVTMDHVERYLSPLTDETAHRMNETFRLLSQGQHESNLLTVENREIQAVAVGGGVAWFTFEQLCKTNRSQNDYLVLAERFHTIMLSEVPQLSSLDFSPARRFTWLLDVMYDHKLQIVISAACPVEELYTSGSMANEFVRTVSRVTEMQSVEYLQQTKREQASL